MHDTPFGKKTPKNLEGLEEEQGKKSHRETGNISEEFGIVCREMVCTI